jgi:hypothetical protein
LCSTVVTRRGPFGGTFTTSVGSWFNEIVGTGDAESFHPNVAGQAALAAAVNAS